MSVFVISRICYMLVTMLKTFLKKMKKNRKKWLKVGKNALILRLENWLKK